MLRPLSALSLIRQAQSALPQTTTARLLSGQDATDPSPAAKANSLPALPTAAAKTGQAESEAWRVVYRRDQRPTDQIFKEGFTARGKDLNLFKHVMGEEQDQQRSGYISTAKTPEGALAYRSKTAAFLYRIRLKESEGIDVKKAFGLLPDNTEEEEEIAVPFKISPERIVSAQYHDGQRLHEAEIVNPLADETLGSK